MSFINDLLNHLPQDIGAPLRIAGSVQAWYAKRKTHTLVYLSNDLTAKLWATDYDIHSSREIFGIS